MNRLLLSIPLYQRSMLVVSVLAMLLALLCGDWLSGYMSLSDGQVDYNAVVQGAWYVWLVWGLVVSLSYGMDYRREIWGYCCSMSWSKCYESLLLMGFLLWPYRSSSIKYAGIAVLLLRGIAWCRGDRSHRPMPYLVMGMLAVFGLSLLALLWSPDKMQGMQLLERQVVLAVYALLSVVVVLPRSSWMRLFVVIFRVAQSLLFLQVLLYLYYASIYTDHLWDCLSLTKHFFTRSVFDTYFLLLSWSSTQHPSLIFAFLVVPWLLGSYASNRGHSISRAELGVYLVGLLLLWLSMHPRSGFFSFCLLLIYFSGHWFALYGRRFRRFFVSFWRLCFMGLLSLAALVVIFFAIDYIDPMRGHIHLDALASIVKSPWLGWGTGMDKVLSLSHLAVPSGHNTLLSVVLELGLPGVLVLGYIWWSLLWSYVRGNSLPLLGVIVLLPLGMTESLFHIYHVIPVVAIVAFLFTLPGEQRPSPICPLGEV